MELAGGSRRQPTLASYSESNFSRSLAAAVFIHLILHLLRARERERRRRLDSTLFGSPRWDTRPLWGAPPPSRLLITRMIPRDLLRAPELRRRQEWSRPKAIIRPVIREGWIYAAAAAAIGVALAWAAGWPWAWPLFVLAAFFLWFFRNPRRLPPTDPTLVVSPADGKVTSVETLAPPAASQAGYAHRISIFLSIFDVHVNRAPASGEIAELRYRRGRFLNAMNPASARENEQNYVALDSPQGRIAFVQIAGLLARRIVFWPKLGERVERGQLVGLIKFGSRVDVFLPAAAELMVRRGERVQGGRSPLARLPVLAAAPGAPAPSQHASF